MAKSAYVLALDHVQGALATLLGPLGFIRRGRTFNRTVGDGLVHVVNIQFGPDPGSHHRRFTVNLGVFVPVVHKTEYPELKAAFIQEHWCHIRSRLGAVAGLGDTWWDLDQRVAQTVAQVQKLMDRFGVPWLDRYEIYEDVLEQLSDHGVLGDATEGRSALIGALICVDTDRFDEASEWFKRARECAQPDSGFAGYVERIRAKCGV